MPQTQFKATGITKDNADKIQDAGMQLTGINWVNVNETNIVLTHDEGFDFSLFENALKSTDANVSITQA